MELCVTGRALQCLPCSAQSRLQGTDEAGSAPLYSNLAPLSVSYARDRACHVFLQRADLRILIKRQHKSSASETRLAQTAMEPGFCLRGRMVHVGKWMSRLAAPAVLGISRSLVGASCCAEQADTWAVMVASNLLVSPASMKIDQSLL